MLFTFSRAIYPKEGIVFPGLDLKRTNTMASNLTNQVMTIWQLPPQPLPVTDVKDPTFMTIWLFTILVVGYLLRKLLYRQDDPTWPEFRGIWTGTEFLILCVPLSLLCKHVDRGHR